MGVGRGIGRGGLDPTGEIEGLSITGEDVVGSMGEIEGLSSTASITTMHSVPLCVSALSLNPGRHSHV